VGDESAAPGASGCILAVDLGTGGPKVGLVSLDGDVIACEAERVALLHTPDGGVEQDPDEWWRAITTASRRLMQGSPVAPDDVVAVCMSAQWGGTVPVDADGRQTHHALIWMDGRGAPYSQELAGGGVEIPGTGYNARKLRTWIQKTGGVPSRTGKDPVGQIQWLRHRRPEAYRATRWFLDVPEYLTMRACGVAAASYDSIVPRWCTDNRDPSAVHYDDELLELTGLDRATLPDLRPPGTVLGPVLDAAAHELGIGRSAQVVIGTGDTISAGIGAGAVRDFDAHLYIGTSAWVSCNVPFKRTSVGSTVASLPTVVPGRYWVATEQDVAGKAIEWLAENLGEDVDALNDLAASAPAGSNGVIFTPWLNGERTPFDDPHVRGGWFNVSLTSDRADLVRSVFEGVALNTRLMMRAAEKFVRRGGPKQFASLRFIGGGARSDLWCQALADILDRPIERVADPSLANVRGAGLLAAVALGHCSWDEVPDRVRIDARFQPDTAAHAIHAESAATFSALYKSTRKLYAKRATD
jgi:xylulokinase